MIHNSDGEIRKLIDPKSGFTLYVRKFDDAAISQVSTLDSFPTPQPMPYGNDIINNVDDIKKELKTLQQQSAEAISTNQELVHALNKKNAGLAKLVLILALCMLASIFI